ncbi:tyrosine-protein phosphatase (plasmid) [Diaphorobacter sp. HDW4B]|uniref:tyrosine-protein phosphatase n=1 Tax=Diaphorobacter sp. HDW4B TaxID=2714925 RepID=UPI00140C08AF|nr:tyrosine-protein phosphatase [Diaphorobacter sp. HDW4B]QIL74041.1 tyrosine-protein phosphatase [Diaphorobacter sp. HDW4B]
MAALLQTIAGMNMAAIEQAVSVFGSMDACISNALGVDDRARELLRQKLLA